MNPSFVGLRRTRCSVPGAFSCLASGGNAGLDTSRRVATECWPGCVSETAKCPVWVLVFLLHLRLKFAQTLPAALMIDVAAALAPFSRTGRASAQVLHLQLSGRFAPSRTDRGAAAEAWSPGIPWWVVGGRPSIYSKTCGNSLGLCRSI